MINKKLSGVKCKTPKFRVNWPYLFEPREQMDKTKPKQYMITMLFDKETMGTEAFKKMQKACVAAGIEAWGEDKTKWPKLKHTPFKDQATALKKRDDGKEYLPDGYTAGNVMLTAKSQQKVALVDRDPTIPIINKADFYSGCYALAVVVFKAYDVPGNVGITTYLQMVQKHSDGENLAGRTKPEDEFSVLTDESSFSTGGETVGSEDTAADALMG